VDLGKYLFLAFLQGVTEFLPVSSSGHLVFFQSIFDLKQPLISFDIVLHLATILAVIVFLRQDLVSILNEVLTAIKRIRKGQSLKRIWQELLYFRLFVLVCIALIPTVFFAILILPKIETLFSSLSIVGLGFFITGTVLFLTKYISGKKKPGKFKGVDALIVGIAQAAAIIPGVSRSGLTIAGGIFRGINRQLAARFSFLLAIPTIAAAACYGLKDGLGEISVGFQDLVLSFIVAFISGYVALWIISKMVAQARFHYFSYYCWTMSIVSFLVSINR